MGCVSEGHDVLDVNIGVGINSQDSVHSRDRVQILYRAYFQFLNIRVTGEFIGRQSSTKCSAIYLGTIVNVRLGAYNRERCAARKL